MLNSLTSFVEKMNALLMSGDGPRVVGTIAIFAVGMWVASVVHFFVQRAVDRSERLKSRMPKLAGRVYLASAIMVMCTILLFWRSLRT